VPLSGSATVSGVSGDVAPVHFARLDEIRIGAARLTGPYAQVVDFGFWRGRTKAAGACWHHRLLITRMRLKRMRLTLPGFSVIMNRVRIDRMRFKLTVHPLPISIKEFSMTKIEKVLFSGNTHTTVNHNPSVQRGEYGVVDIKLSAPGGQNHEFIAAEPHPSAEQLFAGAWSACYISALGIAASLKKITLPPDSAVDIQVNIGQTGPAWFLGAQFTVRVPGLAQDVAEAIAHAAHQICPYSKAVHGNIEVAMNVVTA
jgi:osmotically inducible protein OsmC